MQNDATSIQIKIPFCVFQCFTWGIQIQQCYFYMKHYFSGDDFKKKKHFAKEQY